MPIGAADFSCDSPLERREGSSLASDSAISPEIFSTLACVFSSSISSIRRSSQTLAIARFRRHFVRRRRHGDELLLRIILNRSVGRSVEQVASARSGRTRIEQQNVKPKLVFFFYTKTEGSYSRYSRDTSIGSLGAFASNQTETNGTRDRYPRGGDRRSRRAIL